MHRDAATAVESLFAACRQGDIAGMLDCCSDDIVFVLHVPPSVSRYSGEIVGKPAVERYLRDLLAAWSMLDVRPGPMRIDGGLVREVTRFRSRFRATGDVFESNYRHIWHVEDGLITRCEEYQDTPMLKAFLSLRMTV
jgi:hypothetical protein